MRSSQSLGRQGLVSWRGPANSAGSCRSIDDIYQEHNVIRSLEAIPCGETRNSVARRLNSLIVDLVITKTNIRFLI